MGYATTRTLERVLAAVGKLGAPAATEFEPACDVAGGGVLAGVPALLAQGLLRRPPSYYCDGHVRVYHGEKTPLPRHYVARERLCLRATVDYWVNAMDGQPFLYVNKEVDPGLIATIKNDVVPWLQQLAPKTGRARTTAGRRSPRPLVHTGI